MRYAAKVDTNQALIVEALRWAGATVALTHRVGAGFPDVVAGVSGLFNLLFEIKAPKGTLTNSEGVFHCTWAGQLDTVRTPEQAIALYEKYRHLATLLKETIP